MTAQLLEKSEDNQSSDDEDSSPPKKRRVGEDDQDPELELHILNIKKQVTR